MNEEKIDLRGEMDTTYTFTNEGIHLLDEDFTIPHSFFFDEKPFQVKTRWDDDVGGEVTIIVKDDKEEFFITSMEEENLIDVLRDYFTCDSEFLRSLKKSPPSL